MNAKDALDTRSGGGSGRLAEIVHRYVPTVVSTPSARMRQLIFIGQIFLLSRLIICAAIAAQMMSRESRKIWPININWRMRAEGVETTVGTYLCTISARRPLPPPDRVSRASFAFMEPLLPSTRGLPGGP